MHGPCLTAITSQLTINNVLYTTEAIIDKHQGISIILPTFNESGSINEMILSLLELTQHHQIEILIVDDDSADGTANIVRELARQDSRIRIIQRVGRSGLASAIKEGLIAAVHPLAIVMDSDGQHEPLSVQKAFEELRAGSDLVAGSRFLDRSEIHGLSSRRTDGSTMANRLARWSLPKSYAHLTDYMSGFIALKLDVCLPIVRKVDVNGFKFLYELLAISKGQLRITEIPLRFQPRLHGNSKLDYAVLWDFLISLIHTFTFRLLPRRAISFGLVGASGVVIQLLSTFILMSMGLSFSQSLPLAVITAASSNYLVNNILTFGDRRQKGRQLLKGLLKFLLVASLPTLANVGLATGFYNMVQSHAVLAQLAGIIVVYIWNYAASSRFVWNTP